MDKTTKNQSGIVSKHESMLIAGLIILLTAIVTGCASVPAPKEQMAVSKTEIENALSNGGNEAAPLQLKSAMEKMNAAERAMVEKAYLQARRLAEQAQLDAKLAGAMARSAKAQKAVDALQDDRRVLRNELERQIP